MRYLLYESEQGKTLLSHEVDFMKNYIDLMKLRLSNKVELMIDFPENISEHHIPPLLFVPFIENAFKHGISYREKSFVHIAMKSENDKITFQCSNSMNSKAEKTHSENHSGIGLENVKKRLNLLFPGSHILKIDTSGNSFDVLLEIDLLSQK